MPSFQASQRWFAFSDAAGSDRALYQLDSLVAEVSHPKHLFFIQSLSSFISPDLHPPGRCRRGGWVTRSVL